MRNKGKNRSTASIRILYVHVDFSFTLDDASKVLNDL